MKIKPAQYLSAFGLALLMGCAGLNRNVYEAENTTTDGISSARHTFNVWYQEEMQVATAAKDSNRITELNADRDYVRAQTYRAGTALRTIDQLRQDVAANANSTNTAALQIALDALPAVGSNLTWAVKYFMGGAPVPTFAPLQAPGGAEAP